MQRLIQEHQSMHMLLVRFILHGEGACIVKGILGMKNWMDEEDSPKLCPETCKCREQWNEFFPPVFKLEWDY